VSIAPDNNTSASAICVRPYQNSPHGQVTTTAGRPTAVLVQGLIHIGPEGSQGQQSPDPAEETEIAKAKSNTPVDRQRLSQVSDFT
jgi:hypothetical protein